MCLKIPLGFDIGAEMCRTLSQNSFQCLLAGYGARFPGIMIVYKGQIPEGRKLAGTKCSVPL